MVYLVCCCLSGRYIGRIITDPYIRVALMARISLAKKKNSDQIRALQQLQLIKCFYHLEIQSSPIEKMLDELVDSLPAESNSIITAAAAAVVVEVVVVAAISFPFFFFF